MKIIQKDENELVFFIQKKITNKIDFDDKNNLENYFQDFFLKLKNNYKIEISGFYKINIYIDNCYGIIITMIKEDIDYFDYFSSNIDMQINKPFKTNFLYKIEDLFYINKTTLKKMIIYFYKDSYYLKPKKNYKKELIKLLDFCEIIFDEKKEEIIKLGKQIKLEV